MAGTINLKKGSSTAEPTAYPCATADLDALIGTTLTDVSVSTYGLTAPPGYTGNDLTAYKILIGDNAEVTTFFADLIADNQRTLQPVYFETHTDWRSNFEQVALTAEPDDWGGNINPSNQHYYYPYNGNLDIMSLCPNYQMPFSPGTYYKNDTLSNFFYTENDGWFGLNLHLQFDPYNANRYALIFDYGNWWTYFWTGYPTQIYDCKARMPGMSGSVVWNVPNGATWQYYNHSGSWTPYTANPTDIPDIKTQFVTGEYQGVTYIGWMAFFKTPEGLFDHGCLYLMPQWFFGTITPTPTGGYWGPPSSSGGGSGTYTDTNDAPDISSAPPNFYSSIGAGNYGLHVYRVDNAASWDAFQSILWGAETRYGSDLWSRWRNYKFNPIQGVIGAHFLPLQLQPLISSLSNVEMRLAGVKLDLTYAKNLSGHQFFDLDCGSISISEFFGTAMDYSPYTTMRMHLPFCGTLDIDPDRCTGGSIGIKYRCDIITGNVCAYVLLTDRFGQTSAMLTATGNCAISIPITGNDQGTGQVVGALGSALMGAVTGNPLAIASGAISAITAQHHMQQTGSVSGSVAAISPMDIRLEIIRPCVSTPDYGTDLRGRPSDIGVTIGDLVGTGFASFSDVHPDISGATAAECAEIAKLLEQGVIL